MIVDAFLNSVRDFIYGDSVTPPGFIAVGTGTTAALASDTTLETEIFPDGANRNAITSRTKPSAKKVRLQTLIAAGEANGHVLTEVGVLNAATGGTLMNRVVHTAINKDASFELKVQILTELSDV
jgi:hypothetical protein